MKNIIVLIPEIVAINYYVFCKENENNLDYLEDIKLLKFGKLKIRDSNISEGKTNVNDFIFSLINNYKIEIIIVKALYGGNEFSGEVVYDKSILSKLDKLVSQSPLNVSVVIRLLKMFENISPNKKVILLFETSFFAKLPLEEQLYAVDNSVINMQVRRYGYHGLFHKAAVDKIRRENKNFKKIISICLEPVPEIAAIYDGHPVMVSSGSTPLEGIPGNTTSGEIDPGILILLEEKKKWGAETINEILTRKSGLLAITGENKSIKDILITHDEKYRLAKELLLNRILLTCGSAMSIMNGFDAVAFSGCYFDAAEELSKWLIPKLKESAANEFSPEILFLKDSIENIIAKNYFVNLSNKMNCTIG